MKSKAAQATQNRETTPNDAADKKGGNAPQLDLASAKAALAKLPILGPVLWLYARDPLRKFTFMADIDWILLPPVILDQYRLYSKNEIPFAFFTWAKVSDAVDQRLRSGTLRIAPHEWKSGEHLWLIDVVTPFGHLEEMVAELHKTQFPGQKISALMPDPQQGNQLKLRDWQPE